jgi:hypothetical protein
MKFLNKKIEHMLAVSARGKGENAAIRIQHIEAYSYSNNNYFSLVIELKDAREFKKLVDEAIAKAEANALIAEKDDEDD